MRTKTQTDETGEDKKALSLYRRTQIANNSYIGGLQEQLDGTPTTIDDLESIFLYIEKRRVNHPKMFDITDTQLYQSAVEYCYKIQRSRLIVLLCTRPKRELSLDFIHAGGATIYY
jgi:hypothetical protein